MSENSPNNSETPKVKRSLRRAIGYAVALPIWVAASFITAQLIVVLGITVLEATSVTLPPDNDPVFNTIIAAIVYVMTLVIVAGLPYLVQRRVTTRQDLGLTRLISWLDILLTPAAVVIYFVFSGLLIYAFSALFPSVDLEQAQEVGFRDLSGRLQYVLAFLTLVVVAPIAEEALFRGYLFGKLKKHIPVWLAVLITSALFALAHGQWNVAVDTFALSIVLCSLREVTGSIWAGVLLHMAKNGIAFYFLFINPALLNTLGG